MNWSIWNNVFNKDKQSREIKTDFMKHIKFSRIKNYNKKKN